jgi:spore coat protein CotF
MDEKTMVNDILSCAKSSLSLYQMGIAETENLQLRQVLQQLRDDTESFQYELFKVAKSKGYYKPAAPADSSEIQTVKTELESC